MSVEITTEELQGELETFFVYFDRRLPTNFNGDWTFDLILKHYKEHLESMLYKTMWIDAILKMLRRNKTMIENRINKENERCREFAKQRKTYR